MTTDDPTKSIEAQIGEHMARWLSEEPFTQDVKYIKETDILKQINKDTATATRTYLPEYAMEESDRARISVLPISMTQTRIARNYWKEDYVIDTMVHQRLEDALIPDFTGYLPEETAEERQDGWLDKVTEFGDQVTKLADEIRMSFEQRGYGGGGAPVQVPGSDLGMCAMWLHCVRQQIWATAQVETLHVLFCNVRHSWVLYRKVPGYA
jgi:hypothetical protein